MVLLFFLLLNVLPIFFFFFFFFWGGGLCVCLCFVIYYYVSFLVKQPISKRKRELVASLLLSDGSLVTVNVLWLPHGAVSWSVVCYCGISWSYSLIFSYHLNITYSAFRSTCKRHRLILSKCNLTNKVDNRIWWLWPLERQWLLK